MTIKEKIEKIKESRLTEEELLEINEKMDDLIRLTSRPLKENEYVFFEKHLYLFPDEHKYLFRWSVDYKQKRLIDMIIKYYNPNNDDFSKEEIKFCLDNGYYNNVYLYAKYGFDLKKEYIDELKIKFNNDRHKYPIQKEEIFRLLNRIKYMQNKRNRNNIKYNQ